MVRGGPRPALRFPKAAGNTCQNVKGEHRGHHHSGSRRQEFCGSGNDPCLGQEIGNVDEGTVEIFLPNSDAVTQQHGFFHGGAIATLADDAAAFAAYTMMEDGRQPLTIEFKINFLAPAEGPQLRAIGTVLRAGRSVAHSRADVFAQATGGEVLVATALATIKATQAVINEQ
ncbi:PaaI family thioesterase [Actibacterium pelagium]|nr:PaaI family thioesterase [Actibacterium pelagium]